jgi:hypothetical protein
VGRSSGTQTLGSLAATKGNAIGGEGSVFGVEPVGSDGEVLTANAAATRGFDWQTAAGGGGSGSSFVFQDFSDASIADDTETLLITFGVDSSSGSNFTSGATRITVNAAIAVDATAAVSWAANSTGFRYIELQHKSSGGTVLNRRRQTCAASSVASQPTNLTVSGQFDCADTDFIEVRVFQNSGGSLGALGGTGDGRTALDVHEISSTGPTLVSAIAEATSTVTRTLTTFALIPGMSLTEGVDFTGTGTYAIVFATASSVDKNSRTAQFRIFVNGVAVGVLEEAGGQANNIQGITLLARAAVTAGQVVDVRWALDSVAASPTATAEGRSLLLFRVDS